MTVVRVKDDDSNLWSKIELANKSIQTTNIKGKEYAEVNQRVKAFRFVYPRGKIETKIINLDGDVGNRTCLMRCEIFDDLGNLLSTGYAEEKESSTFINKTSFIENCETSCIGRALGQSGFGIDTSIASYEEVENAINNQGARPTRNEMSDYLLVYNEQERAKMREAYSVNKDEDMPKDVIAKLLRNRKAQIKEARAKIDEEYRKSGLDKDNPFY